MHQLDGKLHTYLHLYSDNKGIPIHLVGNYKLKTNSPGY